jgi:hypothetical protein
MAKTPRSASHWKVIRGVALDDMEAECESWTGRGWFVFSILGPLHDGFALVLHRKSL